MQKRPCLLVINSSDLDLEEKIIDTVKRYAKYYKVKSRNMTQSELDMVIETRCDDQSALIRSVMAIDGVLSASLLSHDGEATF